jgi:iron(III) transport system permease protein
VRTRFGLLKYRWTRPHTLMGAVLLVLLAFLILVPLAIIVAQSVTVQGHAFDVRLAERPSGSLSLVYWRRLFALPLGEVLLYRPLTNTLLVASVTGVLATLLGSFLAWLVVRTDLPGRALVGVLAIVPNIVPSFALALAWLLVFRTAEFSVSDGLLAQLGSAAPAWLAYGPVAIIAVLTVNYMAFSFLLVSISLRKVDISMEDNAAVLGASTFRILRTVTLPLVIPALVSSFILSAAAALGTFAVPQFLGSPVRFNLLSTVLYQNIGANRYGEAFVQTILLILITASLIWLYAKLVLGSRRSFVTISGKGFATRLTPLGRWRWPIAVAVQVFLVLVAVFPLVMIVSESFLLRTGRYALENLTLHYWVGQAQTGWGPTSLAGVFTSPATLSAMWNSLRLGLVSAVLVGVASFLFGYVIVRGKGSRLTSLVDQASFVPYLIPGIVFGAMYLSSYAAGFGPIPALYGSYVLIVAAVVTNLLPFAARVGTNVQTQISSDLEDTALTFGSWWRAFTRVLLPMSKDGFVITFIIAFIGVTKELDLVALLVPARDPVLTWFALVYYGEGYFQHWAAISVIILAVTFVVVMVSYWLGFKVLQRQGEVG